MEKITVGITTEFITISNLLKYAGVLETGGQAHEAIEAGVVMSVSYTHLTLPTIA